MPLHTACSSSNLEVVKVLLEKGADVAARDKVHICTRVRMKPDTDTRAEMQEQEFVRAAVCVRMPAHCVLACCPPLPILLDKVVCIQLTCTTTYTSRKRHRNPKSGHSLPQTLSRSAGPLDRNRNCACRSSHFQPAPKYDYLLEQFSSSYSMCS